MTRILLIADVGGERTRHIGDEAMLEANLGALRARLPGVACTVVTRDPAWVAQRYGVDAVPLFASGAQSTIDAVSNADGVIVSGGGNLSSTWPDLLRERIELLELARRFGKPAVVLGQTLGPHLEEDQRRALGEALSYASFVGVREHPSILLALNLGVPPDRIWYQSDDAALLDDASRDENATRAIAVTIDPQVRAYGRGVFDAFARQLRVLADETAAPLLLIAHAFGGALSDETEARALEERIGATRVQIAGGLDARETRRLTANAAFVISSRYHPLVFGLAAGVPCVGIYGDDYCRIKVQGAFAHAGQERFALTYEAVREGALLTAARAAWGTSVCMPRDEYPRRWSAIVAALEGRAFADPALLFGREPEEIVRGLAKAAQAQERWTHDLREASIARYREELLPRRTLVRYAKAVRRRIIGR